MKMWEGRFKKELASEVNDFNSSLPFDCRMYKDDITGSIAHAGMLAKCGIIGEDDGEKIIQGLKGILDDFESGALSFDSDAEDIHMYVEQILTQRIGDVGKKLHTARSRNDQVALDIRLYLRRSAEEIQILLKELLTVICNKAEENVNTVMPSYTHLQRAQPVTFGHHLMAYGQMFRRDIERLRDAYKRINIMPLGACAVAGTTYPTNRQLVADELGFFSITENSMDSVSDRDFVIELCFALSLIMMHLSRFSEEMIMWCSAEFSFIELDDAYSTGSSIMPQKKNPDIAELTRGKCARVYGDLNTLLVMMKGLPLAYNKDMQEDKEAVFDAIDNTSMCISIFTKMLDTSTVKPAVMHKAAEGGYINATDCADYLAKRGIPFRDAYKITGGLVGYCIENGKTLNSLTLDEYKEFSPVFENDVYTALDLSTCVSDRRSAGGPAPECVKAQIQSLKDFISD
ncbi:MAG: argininosuccinate lyase [Clostridia bacterium]|nr:argininosuccinate lyase [Clostridia bacterium]